MKKENQININSKIKELLVRYSIGKKPLSKLLGWGESTIIRYLEGDVPSEKYLNCINEIYTDPNKYLEILKSNKSLITTVAYNKSLKATNDYILRCMHGDFYSDIPISNMVRVASDSIYVQVADVNKNKETIIKSIDKALEKDVQLLVLNELCLTGYTCNDLFLQSRLLSEVELALEEIKDYTQDKNIIVVLGAPIKHLSKLYNCGVVICNGEYLGVVPKINIPTYNEFYELRHFVSGANVLSQEINIGNDKVPFGVDLLFKCRENKDFIFGVEICEDLWVNIPPSCKMTQAGASIIVNLSASNEVIGKSDYRRNLVSSQSARCDCGYVYSSAGDGESTQDLVFSGHNIIAEDGIILSETKLFENSMIIGEIDLDKISHERQRKNTYDLSFNQYKMIDFSMSIKDLIVHRVFPRFPFVPNDESSREERCKQILAMQANGLKKRIEHINCKKIVVGLSGGLDSALAILVAAEAMDLLNRDRKDIIAVTMPCFGTTKRTKSNAQLLAEGLKTSFKDINISKAVKQHFEDIEQDINTFDVTFENSQARERTQVLMDIANKEGGIVLGTGDLSELALGWATYNGDHMSMYAVNVSIPKTLIRYIVKYYADELANETTAGALYDILNTPVSPELIPAKNDEITQKTEDIVGPYELHDFFLYYVVRWGYNSKKVYALAVNTFKSIYDKEIILKWLKNFYRRFFTQQFKRSCIPDGPKVGSVSLSPRGDWRMPSDAKFALWLKEVEEI